VRFDKCDICDTPDSATTPVYECVTTRPSDRMCLVCVMAMCADCGGAPDVLDAEPLPGDRVPSSGTYDQLNTWVEDHGYKHGVMFYE
jgi:hypothetical protein